MRRRVARVLALFGLDAQDVRYAVRSFLLVFVPTFSFAAIGWLNDLTQWAPGQPFPDAGVLAAAAVSATASGLVAVFTLVVRGLEGKAGKGILRPDPPRR